MPGFKYEPRSAAQIDKRANQSANQYEGIIKDGFNVFSAKEAENTIRILPPTWEHPDHYGYDVYVHYSVGPENASVLCLSKMEHQACPICEFRAARELQGKEDADEYKSTRRVAVWLVDRSADASENPKIWAMPWTFDRDVSTVCKDRETGELYQIDNPEAGYDIYFDRKGEQLQTRYTGHQLARNPSSVDQKILEFIVANPLPTVFQWRTYKEVKRLFGGDAPAPELDEQKGPVAVNTAPIVSKQDNKMCSVTMKVKGEKMVCSLPAGHAEEDHDFVSEVPATPVHQEFCSKTQTFKGQKYGCGIIGTGHAGDCDFSRELTNGLSVISSAPIGSTTSASSTVDKMRQRFSTGPKQ